MRVQRIQRGGYNEISFELLLTHVTMDLPLLKVVYGEWTDHDGTMVKLALDSSGRRVFYQLYHELPYFLRCPHCPHGYLDTV